MELTVNYLGAVQFEVDARGHKVICDQPVDNGGFDEGMTPPDFLLASLGTCAGYYAVQYLKTRNLPMEGLQVRVTAEKVKPPARLDQFRIEVKLPEAVDEQHIEGVTRSVHKCLIHNTLLNPPKIDIAIETPVRP
jgi:uncharacterized OsmC-like protein